MVKTSSNTETLMEMEGADVCVGGDPRRITVEGVDWRLREGSYWVIGGAPESGKTDVLSTAAGLQPAAHGAVWLFGNDVSQLSEPDLLKQRTRVGFVFKGGGRVFADMTIAENIALPLRYHQNLGADEALETVHALLDLTHLGHIGSERPQRLGISMLQRVGLARALVMRPDLVFLDEPLVGLAWRDRQWWLEFLEKLTAGIPFMNGKKPAVAVTTNDFGPWHGRVACYASLRERKWHALGEQTEPPEL